MEEGWNRLNAKGDWICDYMQPKNTNTYTFRCVGVEDVPVFNLIALFYEMDLIHTWLPFCQESMELGQLAMYCKQGYVRISLYWPLHDRECLLYGYGVDDLDNGNILIFFDSRESDEVDIPKPQVCLFVCLFVNNKKKENIKTY
ncbi:hypothetical protein RFI_08798 [Reticulomyxa filosa]|uniref:START domain-containing protein n=1 Tax=Reticulomyxa filosa TaxID=46433 RepID=X6NSQ2_RETFI|nr:hypothetical protein RFI_08798 [Reticulomyxa filosa]|eukprot:ETO28337.1 hypothetical protein RFI_08798 [Reticulomyxa filosa]